MNIRFNTVLRRYEAEFTTDFHGDLAAVKAAGFKTDGPPAWIWYTAKLKALNALRANKPASGLSITEEAYQTYTRQSEMETKNAAAKAQFAEHDKKAKKERKQQAQEEATTSLLNIPEGSIWVGPENLPPKPPFVSILEPPKPLEGPSCVVCGQPVCFYEQQEPPMCLWCEKSFEKKLDKKLEVV